MRSPETPLLCALFYLKGLLPVVIGLVLRNLSYVLCLSFKAVLSHLAAVLYYVLRVRYCLSVLVYAGVSLFIIVGPYVYLVVCIIYTYNLAWGGLKNGKNGGEPNRFCLVFVMRKNNFGILGKLKERGTFKFCFVSGDFLLLIPPYLFTVHIRPVLSPCQAGYTCCILSCFLNTCI